MYLFMIFFLYCTVRSFDASLFTIKILVLTMTWFVFPNEVSNQAINAA